MNLQTDYLRTFIAVADAQSFTKAGRQVNRTQSAVSMQIKRIEEEVGRPLFLRIGKTARLTSDGKLLLSHARAIVQAHDAAVMALTGASLEGVIRFGSPEHYASGVLPKLLAGFTAAYPDVLVEMRCENSEAIKRALDEGELDIGLCTNINEGGRVIYQDSLVWAAKPDFVAKKGAPLPLAVEDGCIFQDWALEALERRGVAYRVAYVSRGLPGILDAARAGLAVIPVLKRNVPDDLEILGAEHGLPILPASNIVLHTRKPPLPERVKCFAEHIVDAFREEE